MSIARTMELRGLLTSARPTILMEAHNGLSAKLVEEAGFEAIWASGLAISASLGVRDRNEASWTQILEVLEFVIDSTRLPVVVNFARERSQGDGETGRFTRFFLPASPPPCSNLTSTRLPILLDADRGCGNFNNVRRLVGKLERRGAAGVCLEDKRFPRTNSLLEGEKQQLADIREFSGKIRAAKDTQSDRDFVVVARTEAFIAGCGLDEALVRAKSYEESGADAILVHSKLSDASQVQAFAHQWRSSTPLQTSCPSRAGSPP